MDAMKQGMTLAAPKLKVKYVYIHVAARNDDFDANAGIDGVVAVFQNINLRGLVITFHGRDWQRGHGLNQEATPSTKFWRENSTGYSIIYLEALNMSNSMHPAFTPSSEAIRSNSRHVSSTSYKDQDQVCKRFA